MCGLYFTIMDMCKDNHFLLSSWFQQSFFLVASLDCKWPVIGYRRSDRMNLSKFRRDKVGQTCHSPWQGLSNIRNRLRRKINWAICRHQCWYWPIITIFFCLECEIYLITLITQPILIRANKENDDWRWAGLLLVFSNKYCTYTQHLPREFLNCLAHQNRKSWLDFNDVFKCTKAIGNLSSLFCFSISLIVTLQQVVSD